MWHIGRLQCAALAVALSGVAGLTGGAVPPSRGAVEPRLVLWAWERPESLRFADASGTGVAFLAESIFLEQRPVVRPRFQPLKVGPGTPLTAVVRLESAAHTPATFAAEYITAVAQRIAAVAREPQVRAVQIDFDATQSQRGFYRALLEQVRSLLPSTTELSITALGSWCLGDDWLAGLPVDEAVPMMFRMGVDRANITRALASGDDFREPLCRTSVGLSTDEPWPALRPGRRVYIFNPRPWTPATFAAVQRKLTP